MLKVFGFVIRNPKLTHDEYRAGHIGYHNSFGRRLQNIRGYLLNVASNTPITDTLDAALIDRISINEPEGFDQQWDGWGQLVFDELEDYLAAKTATVDKPGINGLEADEMVARVGGDFNSLYGGSPCQFHVDEHVALPVRRPERKIFKLVQFGKRAQGLAPELFRAYLTSRYATLAATIPGLRGLILNFRTELDVMNGFFAEDAEGFTPAGIERRNRFYDGFDVIAEYWFDDPIQYADARKNPGFEDLNRLEVRLFERLFYREVDETVAVLPKRDPPPPFYHR